MTKFAENEQLIGFFYNIQLIDVKFVSLAGDYKTVKVIMKVENEEEKVIDLPIKDVCNTKAEAVDEIIKRLTEFKEQYTTV